VNNAEGNSEWAEVELAFDAILELPEEHHADFLAKLPPAVRAQVESLLRAHFRAGSFLERETYAPSSSGENRGGIALEANTSIGSYRVERTIGAGGMGVVYRALDTKLNRPVAIKFLFDNLADPAGRRRFQREARMASSLNHPHILTVYDTGEFRGYEYLVTEFIDGGTLRDWAHDKKPNWRGIVELISGVAEGLAAAHSAGILHRDIKPENILVGRNGYAKLADFGLAKLEVSPTPDMVTQITRSETTRPGVILGTLAYMSPEQAAGRPTDACSDIFSFGVMLYELLAGQRPFRGATGLEVLQTIIHGEAPPLPDNVPLPLRMVVEKAIEKAPGERYQTARDLAVDLRRLLRRQSDGTGTSSAAVATAVAKPRRWRMGAWTIAALAVLVVGGALWEWRRSPVAEPPRPVVQFNNPGPPETIFTPTITRQPFAISPDGRRLALTATGANGSNLWIRELASLEMHALPGTENVWSMYWAPDSRSIYFSVRRTLKQVNLDSGSLRTVAELPAIPMLAAWRLNGDVLLFTGPGELFEVHPSDGSVQKGKAIGGIRWPQFLPGSDRLIYAVYDTASHQTHVATVDYANPKPLMLMQSDTRAIYSASSHSGEPGYLLFVRGGDLLAQRFDAERQRLIGEPASVAQNVVYFAPNLGASISVSGNGVLAYQTGFPNAELKWYDREGNEAGKVGPPLQHWGHVRLSRDGRRVAATVWSPDFGAMSLWLFDADGRNSRRFTFPPDVDLRPVWSPNGMRLGIGTSLNGGPHLGLIDLGGGAPEVFRSDPGPHMSLPTDWSSDGRFIAMDDGVGQEQHETWIADVTSRKVTPLLRNKFAQWGVAFAPNGKQIAFVSTESGRPEVYLQAFEPFPEPHAMGERQQVSRDGAWLTRWRADGRELFFLGLDNTMNAAQVQGTLQVGEPKSLFRVAGVTQYATTRDFQFDVSPDGQRFILPTTGTVAPPPVTVIQNWQEKFRR
jgi:Tol biopolymer transport system component/predicted Ser/Thr protein kinase